MEGSWVLWLVFAAILGFIILVIVIEDSPPAKKKVEEPKEEKPWMPKVAEVGPDQKWFTKY